MPHSESNFVTFRTRTHLLPFANHEEPENTVCPYKGISQEKVSLQTEICRRKLFLSCTLALCARLPSGQPLLIGRALYLVFSGAPCSHSNKNHRTVYRYIPQTSHASEGVTYLPFTLFPCGFHRTSFYFIIFFLVLRSLRSLPLPTPVTTAHY